MKVSRNAAEVVSSQCFYRKRQSCHYKTGTGLVCSFFEPLFPIMKSFLSQTLSKHGNSPSLSHNCFISPGTLKFDYNSTVTHRPYTLSHPFPATSLASLLTSLPSPAPLQATGLPDRATAAQALPSAWDT